MKNLLFIFALTVLLLISSCNGNTHRPQKPCSMSNQLTFTGVSSFDNLLSKTLKCQDGEVTVQLQKPVDYEAGGIPPILANWLLFMESKGREIRKEEILQKSGISSRGRIIPTFVEELYEIAKELYKEYFVYSPALDYDARLCYQADDDDLVSKIVFVYAGSKKHVCFATP